MANKTFRDLHNKVVDFSNPDGCGPFKRTLAFQVGFGGARLLLSFRPGIAAICHPVCHCVLCHPCPLQAVNALITQRDKYPADFNPNEHKFDYMSEFSGKDKVIKAWLNNSGGVGSDGDEDGASDSL